MKVKTLRSLLLTPCRSAPPNFHLFSEQMSQVASTADFSEQMSQVATTAGCSREPGYRCSRVYHRGKSGLPGELSGQAVLSDPYRLPRLSRDLPWAVGGADVLVGPGWSDAEGTQSPGRGRRCLHR